VRKPFIGSSIGSTAGLLPHLVEPIEKLSATEPLAELLLAVEPLEASLASFWFFP